MKAIKFLATAIIAMAATMCSTDNAFEQGEQGEKQIAENATLSLGVYVSGRAPGSTRLLKDLNSNGGNGIKTLGLTEESLIVSLEAWVFNADGTLDGNNGVPAYAQYEDINGGVNFLLDIPCTPGNKTLVVTANTGRENNIDIQNFDFGTPIYIPGDRNRFNYSIVDGGAKPIGAYNITKQNYRTLNELLATVALETETGSYIFVVGPNTYSENAPHNGVIPMSAIENIVIMPGNNMYGDPGDIPSGYNYNQPIDNQIKGNIPMPLTRIYARVALAELFQEFDDPSGAADRFELHDVFVANVPAFSRIFGDARPEGGSAWEGAWGGRLYQLDLGFDSDNMLMYSNIFLYGAGSNTFGGQTTGEFQAFYDTPKGGFTGQFSANFMYSAQFEYLLKPIASDLVSQWAAIKQASEIDIDNGELWAPCFYIPENTNKYPTMLVIQGTLSKNGVPLTHDELPEAIDQYGYTYYTVFINGNRDLGYEYRDQNGDLIYYDNLLVGNGHIYRNTQYNLSVTLKNAGLPYVGKKVDNYLDVVVQVADWEVVNQGVVH